MARLRNAARRAIELDVGFLHDHDPTRSASESPHTRARSDRFAATSRGTRPTDTSAAAAARHRRLSVGIGASVFLIAVGAILTFAVHASVSGIAIHTVGVILMIAGALGLIVTLTIFAPRRRAALSRARRQRAPPRSLTSPHRRPTGCALAALGGRDCTVCGPTTMSGMVKQRDLGLLRLIAQRVAGPGSRNRSRRGSVDDRNASAGLLECGFSRRAANEVPQSQRSSRRARQRFGCQIVADARHPAFRCSRRPFVDARAHRRAISCDSGHEVPTRSWASICRLIERARDVAIEMLVWRRPHVSRRFACGVGEGRPAERQGTRLLADLAPRADRARCVSGRPHGRASNTSCSSTNGSRHRDTSNATKHLASGRCATSAATAQRRSKTSPGGPNSRPPT